MTERTATSSSTDSTSEPGASQREIVREAYDKIARQQQSGCCGSGCGDAGTHAETLGYSEAERQAAPDDANLGLGCGNPTALASLKEGEVVVDLGAGAGFDAFIAAERVGPTGRVIGVDMTAGMLERSRRLAVEHGVAGYVEFREGLVEDLPVVANSVDVIISNCVINLVPDKRRAFGEAFRVLKPGGRLAVSDILLSEPLPDDLRGVAELYVGCVAGALVADEYLGAMEEAGFVAIETARTPALVAFSRTGDPLIESAVAQIGRERLEAELGKVWSYQISARKP